MAASDVFPPNNLSPSSVPWARDMEERARTNAYGIESLERLLNGDNRALAGQMGVTGRNIDNLVTQQSAIQSQQTDIQNQIAELGSRSSGTVSRSNISVVANSSTVFASSSGTIAIPGDGVSTRHNIISFNAPYTFSSAPSVSVFVDVYTGSNTVLTYRMANGQTEPSGWASQIQGSFTYPVASSGTTFTVRIRAINFQASSGNNTITLVTPSMNYVRADKV